MANKVEAGFFSFTEVLGGRHREYNAWHLFDHLPENLKLEGLQWGQRWVATPDLMNRRLAAEGPLAATQYVTLYLMTAPLQPALARFRALARELRVSGRFFEARTAHLSGPFGLVETYAAPGVPVDAAAIPYRPHRGLFVTVHDQEEAATPAALDEARAWYGEVAIPALLGTRGVAGCWWFEALEGSAGPRGRTVTVCWLDDDPAAFLDDLRVPGARHGHRTLLAGAYRTIPWDAEFDWFDGSGT